MKTLICDCNRTMPLDPKAIAAALAKTPGASTDGLATAHSVLCRREAAAFQRAAKATGERAEELLVACTQESRLFVELNEQTEGSAGLDVRPIRFVDIRETGGWSRDAGAATPKIAALIAAAQLPPPAPVATVRYRSQGRCLVVGAAEAAERAAAMLADRLELSLLVDRGAIAQPRRHAVHAGRLLRLAGWLGAFSAEWASGNPIDLDLCTRCNACVDACPEAAIDFGYQVDLGRCRAHRECVRVCEAAGAIDFARPAQTVAETFDLVLDLRSDPAFTMHAKPQGYFHADPRRGDAALAAAVIALRDLTGEFDKPKFFHYREKVCAHSRNQTIGCSACIDVCSARAIASDASLKGRARGKGPAAAAASVGGGVRIEPHLCVGCGACSTVCPSGAMGYVYPDAADQGRRLRTLLAAYTNAGGRDAALLIHSEGAGAARIGALGRAARATRREGGLHGVPARVLPVAVWHTASVGIDLWLAAIAFGASQVWVLLSDEEAPEYRQMLGEQMALAQALLAGLGYAGEHFGLLEARDDRDLQALDAALRAAPAATVARPATFAVQADKRATLELAIDHLAAMAPAPLPEAVALPAAGAPFGTVRVDTAKCTLCLACVGACPAGALLANPEKPQLRFVEKNCVQCGLCERTCPEDAVALEPRLLLADGGRARRTPRVLAEMEPYRCVRCGKPFGTLRAIEAMIGKLAGHAAFQGAAAERLKMCNDCRVIDMFSNPGGETKITDL